MCTIPAVPIQARPSQTTPRPRPSEIELDTPWKEDVYEFTAEHLQHPAWGLAHAERDFLLATELAAKSNLKVDSDVLFAAAFLHDMGGFAPYAKPGVDHADRSAELCDTILRPAGFPEDKLEAVRRAIETHSYYTDKEPATNEALVLHDADTLDFMGAMGAARILAITGKDTPDLASSVGLLEKLAQAAPASIKSGPYAEQLASQRLAEMRAFLDQLHQESYQGQHL